jgi:hypothetical protein
MLLRAIEWLTITLSGRRSRKQIFTTTSASATMSGRRQQSTAQEALDQEQAELDRLKQQQQEDLDQLARDLAPDRLQFQKAETPPRKADIDVDEVLLVWLPHRTDAKGVMQPAYTLPTQAMQSPTS